MAAFGVIVCPKCREHAQIIELAGAKKTKCQKCGSNLEVRKLRLFLTSESLEEVVSARTLLQARLHGQEHELENVFSEMPESGKTALVFETGEFDVPVKDLADKRELPGKKHNHNRIILDLLRSNSGRMDVASLKILAEEHGIEGQKFEQILEKLVRAGEVYEPSTGTICLI